MDSSKSIAAITSERHKGVLESILPPTTRWCVSSNPNVRGQLAEWERLNVDVVVVDDDGLPFKEINENDLYTYPATASRKMQIVFLPAADRQDHDPFLAKLVKVGIYDIVDPRLSGREAKEAIGRMIERPSIFSDAARYFDEEDGLQRRDRKGKRRSGKQDSGVIRKLLSPNKNSPGPHAADPLSQLSDDAPMRRCVVCDAEYPQGKEACPECGFSPSSDAGASTGGRIAALRESLFSSGANPDPVQENDAAGACEADAKPDEEREERICEARLQALERLKALGSAANGSRQEISHGVGSPTKEAAAEHREVSGQRHVDEGLLEEIVDMVLEIVDERMDERMEECMERMRDMGTPEKGAARSSRITVAVSELLHGAGSTSLAMGLSFFVARRWPDAKVACALTDRSILNALVPEGAVPVGQRCEGLVRNGVTIGMLGAKNLQDADWLITDCGIMNYTTENRARTAFATAALKCMCVPCEPWREARAKEIASRCEYRDRITWTWCFRGGSTKRCVDEFLGVVADGKERRPSYCVLPDDPGYYDGASQVDYYPLVRRLVKGRGRAWQKGLRREEDAPAPSKPAAPASDVPAVEPSDLPADR